MVNKPTSLEDEEQVREFFTELEIASRRDDSNLKVLKDGFTALAGDTNLPSSARTIFQDMADSLKGR